MISLSHTIADDYEYISKSDDAVDKESPDFEELWGKYVDGAGQAPLLAGVAPSKFTLRHLHLSERNKIRSMLSDGDTVGALSLAARAGIVAVSGVKSGGSDWKIERKKIEGIVQLTDACVEQLTECGAKDGLIFEIGTVVAQRMAPRPS